MDPTYCHKPNILAEIIFFSCCFLLLFSTSKKRAVPGGSLGLRTNREAGEGSAGGTAPKNWKNPEYVKGKKELFLEQMNTVSSLITTGKSVLSIPNLE